MCTACSPSPLPLLRLGEWDGFNSCNAILTVYPSSACAAPPLSPPVWLPFFLWLNSSPCVSIGSTLREGFWVARLHAHNGNLPSTFKQLMHTPSGHHTQFQGDSSLSSVVTLPASSKSAGMKSPTQKAMQAHRIHRDRSHPTEPPAIPVLGLQAALLMPLQLDSQAPLLFQPSGLTHTHLLLIPDLQLPFLFHTVTSSDQRWLIITNSVALYNEFYKWYKWRMAAL